MFAGPIWALNSKGETEITNKIVISIEIASVYSTQASMSKQ
jgi:hypothetical protein